MVHCQAKKGVSDLKKFFTSVPLQHSAAGLDTLLYQAVDNSALQMDAETSFPILTAVNGFARPGEDFRLIAVMPDAEATRRNREELSAQLTALCSCRGLSCPAGVETVSVESSQTVAAQTATFRKLLDYVDDDDELYCCMTFGTKPQSQALLLAVQYAYRVKRNASISCIVYGEVDRSGPKPWKKGKVYDMTALTRLDEVVHLLAQRGVADPRSALDAILSL